MISVKKLFFLTVVATSIGYLPNAKSEDVIHHPEALQAVKDLAEATTHEDKTAVAIFDLDDTLINTRERTLRIIKDLIRRSDVRSTFSTEISGLRNLKAQDIHFSLEDTLAARGITNADFVKAAQDFWLSTFFSNKYCADDKPNPGAVRYVRELARVGTKIVYLTGRDIPRMHDGTVENLRKLGFPLDDVQSVLIMKQDPQMDDLTFKISMFPDIAKMGTVVGVFENEPVNVNAHHDAFPQAVAIFLDTIHSSNPAVPEDGIFWVKDFRQPLTITMLLPTASGW